MDRQPGVLRGERQKPHRLQLRWSDHHVGTLGLPTAATHSLEPGSLLCCSSCWSLEARLQGELSQPPRRWPDRPLWPTDRQTQTFGRGFSREAEMGRSRGPAEAELEGCAEPAGWEQTAGMAGGGLQKTVRWRDKAAQRDKRQRRRLPSGLFPSRQPRVFLSLGAAEPSRAKPSAPPPPASQPVRLLVCPPPARRCPPARAGKGSHRSLALPPSSLSLTSFCSACAKPIWNCLNPNIQPPPPPARFLPSLKQALRWLWEEGRRGGDDGEAGAGG
jgi:hypothetical protein